MKRALLSSALLFIVLVTTHAATKSKAPELNVERNVAVPMRDGVVRPAPPANASVWPSLRRAADNAPCPYDVEIRPSRASITFVVDPPPRDANDPAS